MNTTSALSIQCTQSEHHYCTLNTMYTISTPLLHSQYNVHNLNTTNALSIQCTQSEHHYCTLNTMYTISKPQLHSQYNVHNLNTTTALSIQCTKFHSFIQSLPTVQWSLFVQNYVSPHAPVSSTIFCQSTITLDNSVLHPSIFL